MNTLVINEVNPRKRVNYMRNAASKNKAVAYCHCKAHKGNLSVKMLKQHECLGKQCPYLEKYESHDYWRQREALKAKKKEKRFVLQKERELCFT